MNDINQVWDIAGRISAFILEQDLIEIKQRKIKSLQEHRCGNCQYWMKSSCIPEKEHKQFKTMNSPGCDLFQLSESSKYLLREIESE